MEARIGVYVCWCGTNIAMMVDVEDLVKDISNEPNVVLAKDYKYMCSDPGQDIIVKDIQEHNLNRIVVAACSPRMHEKTFRKALETAGINPYMLEMANIREQVSWVHTDRVEATKKAKALVRGAIKRVIYHESLEKRFVDINPATLIIGGGISGISAALEIAESGKKVYLIEKNTQLGGNAAKLDLTYPYLNSARQTISPLIEKVKQNRNVEVYLNSQVEEISGYFGNFEAEVSIPESKVQLNFGNVILATGLKTFEPSGIAEYGYGKYPNVITSLEFEEQLKSGLIQTKEGKVPQNIGIIHCVGSRNDEYNAYCSRTCCLSALKYANQIQSALPNSYVFDIYSDMRAFGKGCEEMYTSTSQKNVMFLMFDQKDNLPVIKENGTNGSLSIEMHELLSGEQVSIAADLVILMTGMEGHDDAMEVAHMAGVSLDKNNFFIERHPKLDPVATTTNGIYIVGTCQAPKDIPDSVSQAKAAAARVLATIAQGKVQVEATTALIKEEVCCGCQFCISVCPYTAISFNEENGVSVVNEVLCKGCGTCSSTCPSGAINSKHFTDVQIMSQINGMLEVGAETI